jgi:hypothetical protein
MYVSISMLGAGCGAIKVFPDTGSSLACARKGFPLTANAMLYVVQEDGRKRTKV